ncbi:toxin-antitoxin system, toxin component [Ornithobacterium rhinotracheale]|uniref:antA/AntB antirepressor family protein n=1 Tax=Ornithobacterium rhinotracheale TaxID=28251 RepID=UPI00129C63CC|nr:antA/AntB antirepressor family protein [Ornithobacterium rhinotracheale]MRI63384.1 toxin-antitoxin system, toxin component [Ornithobacterium rhinotracheale]
MKQLQEIIKGEKQLVDARLLHQEMKVGQDFSEWIKGRINKYDFQKDRDYFTQDNQHNSTDNQSLPQNGGKPLGGRPTIEYHITISMAKELCLLQNNEIGRAYRKYLIAFEENAKKQFVQMPKSINVFGMEALPYDWWLLQNGYSVSSRQRNRRIKNHPEHFYKGTQGWYINKLYAEALLAIKQGKEKLKEIQALPQVLQVEMF